MYLLSCSVLHTGCTHYTLFEKRVIHNSFTISRPILLKTYYFAKFLQPFIEETQCPHLLHRGHVISEGTRRRKCYPTGMLVWWVLVLLTLNIFQNMANWFPYLSNVEIWKWTTRRNNSKAHRILDLIPTS